MEVAASNSVAPQPRMSALAPESLRNWIASTTASCCSNGTLSGRVTRRSQSLSLRAVPLARLPNSQIESGRHRSTINASKAWMGEISRAALLSVSGLASGALIALCIVPPGVASRKPLEGRHRTDAASKSPSEVGRGHERPPRSPPPRTPGTPEAPYSPAGRTNPGNRRAAQSSARSCPRGSPEPALFDSAEHACSGACLLWCQAFFRVARRQGSGRIGCGRSLLSAHA